MIKRLKYVVSFFALLPGSLYTGLARDVGLKRTGKNAGIFFFVLSIVLVPLFVFFDTPLQSSKSASASTSTQLYGSLGQPLWNGVSSWLFGTNDTEEYSTDSILTDPNNIIIPSLAQAHFGLVRSFFFHYTIYGDTNDHRTTIGTNPQDTKDFTLQQYENPAPSTGQLPGDFYEIERRIDVIQKIGATCLGVLPSITTDPASPSDGNPKHNYVDPVTNTLETDLQFDEEVVAYLGSRCNLYEFGNEPDTDKISETTYVQKWNEFVPKLKALNPNAKFIGPVLADDQGLLPCTYPVGQLEQCFMTTFLEDIAAGNVKPVPDAISFHWYPCTNVDASTESQCLSPTDPYGAYSYSGAIKQVRDWMQQILGHTLPLGITEWNADPGSNPYMNNASFMTQYTTDALQSMISSKLDFAAEFDAQSGSGYTYLDMFDLNNNDQPKAEYSEMAQIIGQYYHGTSPTSALTKTPTGAGASTPAKVSISFTGQLGSGGSNTNSEPNQKLDIPSSAVPNNVMLDLVFIVCVIALAIGISLIASRKRKKRSLSWSKKL
jgi:hypothetical protein